MRLRVFASMTVILTTTSFASALELRASHHDEDERKPGVRLAQNTEASTAATPAPAAQAEPPKAEMRAEPVSSDAPTMKADKPVEMPPNELKVHMHIEPSDVKVEDRAIDKTSEKLLGDLKRNCERHFSGLIQSEVRAACVSAGRDFARLGKLGHTLVQTRCRLNYGEEPRLVMACLVGSTVAEDLNAGQEGFKKKLQLCAENYPVHNEIDEVFLESCLTGIHIPDLMKVDGQERFEACSQITPERSFIGPCAVGLSLAQDAELKVAPASQNKMCDQYFNLNRFHKGYRACLNARSLAPVLPTTYGEAIKGCKNVESEVNNDTERAACLVGIAIYRHLARQDDISKRFQKCGDAKVTYQDRDILACLTAASLLDFTDKSGAEIGCKEVFKELKSGSRGDCMKSVGLF